MGTLTYANHHCVIFSQLTKRNAEADGGELVLKKASPSEIRIVRVHTHIYSMCTHTHTHRAVSAPRRVGVPTHSLTWWAKRKALPSPLPDSFRAGLLTFESSL